MNTRKHSARRWAYLWVLALIGLVGLSAQAKDKKDNKNDNDDNVLGKIFNPDNSPSFSGTWDTVSSGTSHYVLELKQDGKKVTGNYMPGNGKVDGKIKNGTLDVRWTQDGGSKGLGRLTLSGDGQFFIGTYNDGDDPAVQQRSWNGWRRTKPFAGNWNMVLGGNTKHSVTLQQMGDRVEGSFSPGNGRINNGQIEGNKVSFKWSQDGGSKGKGHFELSEDGMSFKGKLTPTEGPMKDEIASTGTRAPASFNGDWNWNGGPFGDKIGFIQQGDRVNVGQDVTGKIVGNVLFFNWGATGLNHSGFFVMDQGGKSSKTILKMNGAKEPVFGTATFAGP